MKKNPANNTATGICVTVAEKEVATAIARARDAARAADVVEIRLDCLADAAVPPFFSALSTPLLFTNRPTWEGGGCRDDEERRIALLTEACARNAAFVDLELKAPSRSREKVLKAAEQGRTRVIVSWHDFTSTPAENELATILDQQWQSGARIGKIVTMAHSFEDVLRVLNLQTMARKKNFSLIAFCMGRTGMISRVATLALGGFMTYAAPDHGPAAAPGQLPVSALRTILSELDNAA